MARLSLRTLGTPASIELAAKLLEDRSWVASVILENLPKPLTAADYSSRWHGFSSVGSSSLTEPERQSGTLDLSQGARSRRPRSSCAGIDMKEAAKCGGFTSPFERRDLAGFLP